MTKSLFAWFKPALLAIAAAWAWMIVMQQNTPTPLAQVVGTWQNTAAPYKHRMQIAYRQPFYAVSFDLQTKSCGGSVDGLATYDEAQQMLLFQSPVADGEACSIRIQVLGEQAIVTENSACLYYHGVACNFEGRFEKMPPHLEVQNPSAKMMNR